MKRSMVALLHLGFWGCYLIMLLLMVGIYFHGEVDESKLGHYLQILIGFFIIPSAISFYTFYFFLFPRYLQQRKVLLSIIYGILIASGTTLLGLGLLCLTIGRGEDYTLECFMPAAPIMLIVSLLTGIIALVIKGFITWFEEIQLKDVLKQKNHQMELALVKSQLDPHFLFNTINNIDVLIIKNANEASNYLNKLSDIMRFMLFETKTNEILLSKELEYIEKYIALQKIRTANSNYVSYDVSGHLNGQSIAPMVFIPFIENAFKHTNNKKLKDAIQIRIAIEKDAVRLICENKIDPGRKTKKESNGLGNELIQKRLHLIYPEKHRLKIVHQDDLYQVHLTIDL